MKTIDFWGNEHVRLGLGVQRAFLEFSDDDGDNFRVPFMEVFGRRETFEEADDCDRFSIQLASKDGLRATVYINQSSPDSATIGADIVIDCEVFKSALEAEYLKRIKIYQERLQHLEGAISQIDKFVASKLYGDGQFRFEGNANDD